MTDEETIKKMYECEKCHIRFESYDEAIEHEKNCMAQEEKIGAERGEIAETTEMIEKKEAEMKEMDEEKDEYVDTDIEQELDTANGQTREVKVKEGEIEKIEDEEIKEAEEEETEEDEEIEEKEEKKAEEEEKISEEKEAKIEKMKEEKIQEEAEEPEIKTEEEKKEEKTKCTLCGLCRLSCPAYSVLLNEAASPRGKAMMLKRDCPSKFIYLCTLCKACEKSCVLKDIDLVDKIREFRKDLVQFGIKTKANEEMIENIRKHGNALGKAEPGKKVTLWCC
jgi:ferredoxin